MKNRAVLVVFVVAVLLLLVGLETALAAKEGQGPQINTRGVPLYVIIEVEWNALTDLAGPGSWTVWGPKWDPEVGGEKLTSCGACIEIATEFTFHGKTVHFDEVYVPSVTATPQIRHVVLHDPDGDGTYTGSIPAEHYFPWRPEPDGSWPILYIDRIEYTVTFDEEGNLTYFHYLQYEHKKLE